MKLPFQILSISTILTILDIQYASATTSTSFLGPAFPPPQNVTSALATTVKDLASNLTKALNAGSTIYGNFTPQSQAVSVLAQSIYEDKPFFSYNYNSSLIPSNVSLTDRSIYRIGSISKLFTVYTLLVQSGFQHFDDLVVDHVPELKQWANKSSTDPATVKWEEVTIGSLAGQLAGIPRDFMSGDLATVPLDWVSGGFPPLNASEVPSCGVQQECSRAEFFAGFPLIPATFPTYQTPTYSNAAFRLLAYAIADITGKSFGQTLQDAVLSPLGLNDTSLTAPSIQDAVVVKGDDAWNFDLGDDSPAGGMFSSTSNLITLANAILKYQQLTPALTRRWLKPVTHTASLTTSVGAPWEIHRTTLSSGRIVDLYAKSGDEDLYNGLLVLIPDYGVSFTTLTAGPSALVVQYISDMIVTAIAPQLEKAAQSETAGRFAGTYKSTTINSSLSLTTDNGPGLLVQSWISNGSDIFEIASEYSVAIQGSNLTGIRFFPTLFENNQKSYFRAVFESVNANQPVGTFSSDNDPWIAVDSMVYGQQPVDEIIFTTDSSGNATSIMDAGLRSVMNRH